MSTTFLTPTPTLDSIPELEITTMALAGPGAPMNTQAQALLNRLEYYNNNRNNSSFNIQTGTTYSPVLTDVGSTVVLTSSSAITITIAQDSTGLTFPPGANIDFIQDGLGKVTFVQGTGVTIKSIAGFKVISGQYAAVTLRKAATSSTWYLIGAINSV
jgi:hypothetical protein